MDWKPIHRLVWLDVFVMTSLCMGMPGEVSPPNLGEKRLNK